MIKENINKYCLSESLNNMVKLWLIVALFIIPYQIEIMSHVGPLSLKLSTFIRLLDEITMVICFPLALQKIIHERIKYKHLFPVLFTLIVFSIIGFISGVINSNLLMVTSYGVFYYIKYFLIIFIYAAFFKSFSDYNKIFRVLLITAVIVGFVAFLEEAAALFIRHILEDSTNDSAISTINSIFINITHDNLLHVRNWRVGIYRVSSMMSHYNLLGIYSLSILALYLYNAKKINPLYLFSLLSGVYFSVSRVALAGLIILCIMQAMKGRKWMIMFMIIPMSVFVYQFNPSSEFNMKDKQMMSEIDAVDGQRIVDNMTYRQYGRNIAMEIWKDHPFWGVGPGMFGGNVAKKSKSPFYEEYNFSTTLHKKFSDLDQFWPQALAETGIIGTIVFFNVYIYLLIIIFKYKKLELTVEMKNYLAGLGVITVIIFINTLASSLNIVSILYPYCALTGMGMGIAVNELSLNCKDSSENSIN